jgi:uncharacterized protein YcnI
MKRLCLLTVAAFAALLAVAGPALAHVTVAAPGATPGGYAVATFRVPTESATASTTKLVVQVPPLASVSVQPVPGWTAVTTTSKLATPLTSDDGPVTSAVSRITWTADSGAGIKPGQFQQFPVSMGPLPKASTVSFPAIQYYSDGTVVRWVEHAAPGSKTEPDHPAPTLRLTAADPAATAPKVEKASTTGPTVLSIVALVVAAGALGLAFVSRAKKSSS